MGGGVLVADTVHHYHVLYQVHHLSRSTRGGGVHKCEYSAMCVNEHHRVL